MRILAVLAGLWLAVASPAAAHSLIERSWPAANSALGTAPPAVELWFSEPVDPTFSTATVVDPAGVRVSEPAHVSEAGRKITVPLRGLPPGFYTVRWRVLSSIDGHSTSGLFAFTVGLGTRPPEQHGGSAGPDAGLAAVRWLGFLLAAVAAGAVFFRPLVLHPALRSADPPAALRWYDATRAPLQAVTRVAAAGVILAAGAEVVVRAVTLADLPLGQVLSGGLVGQLLWGTKPGWGALARAAMAVLLLLPSAAWGRILRVAGLGWFILLSTIFALLGGPAALAGSGHLALVVLVGTVYGLISLMAAIILPQVADIRIPEVPAAPWIIAAVLLLGLTVNSHAWGSGPAAVVVDLAHLIAVAVWVGGLVCLVASLAAIPATERTAFARTSAPRFSAVAAASVAGLVATGAYAAWLHVPDLRAMTVTAYGRYLGVKLLLFLPLVALGAVNRFVLRPRLAADQGTGVSRRFLGLISAEVALGAVILFVVALLTATPPSRAVLATTPASPGLRYVGVADDVRITLHLDPVRPGPNQIDVTVTGVDGAVLEGDLRVLLRLVKLDEDTAPVTQTLDARDGGRFATTAALPPGWWEVEAVVRRRGRLDSTAAFPLRLGQAAPAPTDPAAQQHLGAARDAMRALKTWREEEQITDGLGGVIVADVELVRPDRMRARTSAGAEVVFVGPARYLREGPVSWRRETLARPFEAEGVVQYTRGAGSVVFGRVASCGGEPCRVVLWESSGGSAAFAAWIGGRTMRIHKLLMVAPQHFMTAYLRDFDAPIRIDPPQ